MASKYVLGIFVVLICWFIFFQVTAQENSAFIETRRELLGATQLLNLFNDLKDISRLLDYYGRVKDASDFVNWLITQAENYVDKQCQNSPAQQNYCCLYEQFLQCQKCCLGPRPNSSSFELSPAPSPLP